MPGDPSGEFALPAPASRLVRVLSAAPEGLSARLVELEASLSGSLFAPPRILGLPDAAVKEAYFRVRAAFEALGLAFPRGQVVVNLAPACTRKEGSGFDLALALALAVLAGCLPASALDGLLLSGELGLDGRLRPVPGILGTATLAAQRGLRALLCPEENAELAARASPALLVVPLADLGEALDLVRAGLAGARRPRRRRPRQAGRPPDPTAALAAVRGQERARLALSVAAAGGHNLLFCGPPGCGKSLLAACLPALLPPLSEQEALEVLALHTLRRPAPDPETQARLDRGQPPFRAPHHSVSLAGLVGGGAPPLPGEVSLAHRGVLFLDELPEFRRSSLEALRQPLESGRVVLRRARGGVTYPAAFQLVAAMNPCPCGRLGHPRLPCRDTPAEVRRYQGRISGPLLDRIDLLLRLEPVAPDALLGAGDAGDEGSALAERVRAARARQFDRNGGRPNARLAGAQLSRPDVLSGAGRRLLLAAGRDGRLSARALHKVLRVARTLADLDGAARIREEDVAGALHLRMRPFEPPPGAA